MHVVGDVSKFIPRAAKLTHFRDQSENNPRRMGHRASGFAESGRGDRRRRPHPVLLGERHRFRAADREQHPAGNPVDAARFDPDCVAGYALSLTRKFGEQDLKEHRSSTDAIFFSSQLTNLLEYPASWALPLACVATLLLAMALWLQYRVFASSSGFTIRVIVTTEISLESALSLRLPRAVINGPGSVELSE